MDTDSMIEMLQSFGIRSKNEYLVQAFSRNIGLFSNQEQEKLAHAKVAIPGMGGVGGVHFITMVRTGICRFSIADFDHFEPVNINRQFGARVPDFGRSKLEVMKEQALSINPYLEIKLFPKGIQEANIDSFLDGVDVVLDGLDFFKFDIRRLLFKKAAEKGIYVVTAGPMGFSSAMLVFSPEGMGFDGYFNITEGMADKDKHLSFALGLAPRSTHIKYMDLKKVNLDTKAGPSLNIACQICSGMAATEAIKIILNKGKVRPVPNYFQYDPYLQVLRRGRLLGGNKNPVQRIKLFVIKRILEKKQRNSSPKIDIPHKPIDFNHGIPEDVIKYILTIGTWAPSADNCQPWKFSWDGTTLILLINDERSGFFYDVNQESTYLTFGALIENIKIAASKFGFNTVVTLFPNGYESGKIANIVFLYENIPEDPLCNHVLLRCVNREPYSKKEINQEIVLTLKEMVSQTSEADLLWIDNEKDKKMLEQIVFDADRVLFEDARLYQGLFRWINIGGNYKKYGMNLDVLGLNYVQRFTFSMLSDWKKMNFLNKFGASRMAALNSVGLLKSSPAYGLIVINNREPESYVAGGRIMERFWIKANSMGLSLQPMAGFIFLFNHLKLNKCSAFESKHRRWIIEAQERLLQIKEIKRLNREFNPVMFFRMGTAERCSKRTQREKVVLV